MDTFGDYYDRPVYGRHHSLLGLNKNICNAPDYGGWNHRGSDPIKAAQYRISPYFSCSFS
jgi:hypothetical protein